MGCWFGGDAVGVFEVGGVDGGEVEGEFGVVA